MHNDILPPMEGFQPDHKEPSQTLDNRKSNLRYATRCENAMNRRTRSDSSSGIKGVYYQPQARGDKPWYAEVTANKKRTFVGRFGTKEEAAQARRLVAESLHGDFVRHF
jgi:hypothetical protein